MIHIYFEPASRYDTGGDWAPFDVHWPAVPRVGDGVVLEERDTTRYVSSVTWWTDTDGTPSCNVRLK